MNSPKTMMMNSPKNTSNFSVIRHRCILAVLMSLCISRAISFNIQKFSFDRLRLDAFKIAHKGEIEHDSKQLNALLQSPYLVDFVGGVESAAAHDIVEDLKV